MKHLSQILAIAAVVISFSGCKGIREVVREVPVYVHDTAYQSFVQLDSIYIHDSVNVYMVGDTVFVTKSVTKSVTKIKHDTIREVQDIPVEVVRTEVREVERPLNGWQKTLMWLGVGFILCAAGSVVMIVSATKERD